MLHPVVIPITPVVVEVAVVAEDVILVVVAEAAVFSAEVLAMVVVFNICE